MIVLQVCISWVLNCLSLVPVSAGGVVPLDRAVLVHCDGVSREGPSARNIFEDRIRCAGHAQTAEGSASSVLINVSLGEFCVSYSIFHLVISFLTYNFEAIFLFVNLLCVKIHKL